MAKVNLLNSVVGKHDRLRIPELRRFLFDSIKGRDSLKAFAQHLREGNAPEAYRYAKEALRHSPAEKTVENLFFHIHESLHSEDVQERTSALNVLIRLMTYKSLPSPLRGKVVEEAVSVLMSSADGVRTFYEKQYPVVHTRLSPYIKEDENLRKLLAEALLSYVNHPREGVASRALIFLGWLSYYLKDKEAVLRIVEENILLSSSRIGWAAWHNLYDEFEEGIEHADEKFAEGVIKTTVGHLSSNSADELHYSLRLILMALEKASREMDARVFKAVLPLVVHEDADVRAVAITITEDLILRSPKERGADLLRSLSEDSREEALCALTLAEFAYDNIPELRESLRDRIKRLAVREFAKGNFILSFKAVRTLSRLTLQS